MAITFPTSPTNGQTFTSGNKTWQWDGTTWLAYGASLSPTVLKVDSANARVGVNNQSPAYALDVTGTVQGTQFLQGTDYLSPYQGFRNKIINGDMRVDQRASASTAVTTSNYVTDRWYVEDGCDAVFSSQQSTDVPTGQGFAKSLKVTATTADASIGSTQFAAITQHIEGHNFANLAWGSANAKQVVVSFWVKATVTGTYSLTLYNNGASRSIPTAYTISASNTWEKKTVVIAGDTSGTWLTDTGRGVSVNFYTALGSSYLGTSGVWNGSSIYGVTGQANAWASVNNVFAVTGVQLEEGGVATPFEQRPIGTELALCQRYYQKSYNQDVAVPTNFQQPGIVVGGKTSVANNEFIAQTRFPVSMRTSPTIVIYSYSSSQISKVSDAYTGTDQPTGTVTMAYSGSNSFMIYNTSGVTLTSALGQMFHFTASSEL